MTPKLLKTFLTVAETGNMSIAAGRLHLAQSSVSDQIQRLEEELGVVLFTRARGGLALTSSGATLKPYAEGILVTVDEAMAALDRKARAKRPVITVGALETIAAQWLPDWVSSFRQTHPDVDLQLRIANTGELLRMVRGGEADAIFCFDFDNPDRVFASRTIEREPLILIGATTAESERDLGFVVTQKGCAFRRIFDENIVGLGEGGPDIVAEVDSIATIIRLVAKGAGLALVPRMAVGNALESGAVREIEPAQPQRAVRLSLVWRRRRVQPPGLRRMLDGFSSNQPMTAVAMKDRAGREAV